MASVEKRTRRDEVRYVARWRDPDGKQRNKSFVLKGDADRFAATIQADIVRGQYVDPSAGKRKFRDFAAEWLAAQTFNESSRESTELHLRVHINPTLGELELRQIRPSTIQAWLRGLDRLAPNYRRVIYTNLSTILTAAVDDELIVKNPCAAPSVRRPKLERHKIEPWSAQQVQEVERALPERWRIVVTLASGLGLRQGEVFGLSPDDVDFLRGRVEVRRQVKLFTKGGAVFAPPKGGKTRTVPLPESVKDDLAAYLARFPAAAITLPWASPVGEPTTFSLVITTRERTAANRNYFNALVWKPALDKAGIERSRKNGCHALRHWYASVLLDAGENIKALSEYLGHSDPGFTLRVYTHLMPTSQSRTRNAVDAARLAHPCVPDDALPMKE